MWKKDSNTKTICIGTSLLIARSVSSSLGNTSEQRITEDCRTITSISCFSQSDVNCMWRNIALNNDASRFWSPSNFKAPSVLFKISDLARWATERFHHNFKKASFSLYISFSVSNSLTFFRSICLYLYIFIRIPSLAHATKPSTSLFAHSSDTNFHH